MRDVLRTTRYWLPLLIGFGCLVAVAFVGAILAWVLIILAIGFLLDGTTAIWARVGRGGSMGTHRQ